MTELNMFKQLRRLGHFFHRDVENELLQELEHHRAMKDPVTIVTVVIAMSAVTGLAGYLPARRASLVDPMVALRHE